MKYFTFNEFFSSDLADSVGIVNYPSPEVEQYVRNNIIALVGHVLDPIREHVGEPVFVNSGFRQVRLNELVNGQRFSQHLIGQAADISIQGMSVKDYRKLAYWCAENLDFDQLIVYAKQEFIHVSYVSPTANRHEVLFR